MKHFIILAGLIILVFPVLVGMDGTSLSLAEIPRLINYQGMLTNDSGEPLDGNFDLYFRIYNAPSGGTKRWEEAHSTVEVTEGLFNVILGIHTGGGINLDFSENYWLEVQVEKDTLPTRLQFTSVGYAYRARLADTATVAISTPATGGWVDDGSTVRLQTITDNVGIGISGPAEKLHVAGNIRLNSGGDIAFHDNNTRIYHSPDDLYLTSEDDIHLRPDDDIFIRNDGATSDFIRIDPGAKEVGIGTTDPDAMVEIHGSEAGQLAFLELQTSHATLFQETGIRFKTPAHTWYLRMDGYNHNNLPDTGSLSLRSHTTGELMIWTPDGDVGIGTTEPDAKLEVSGDLKVTGSYKGNISSSSGSDGAPFPRPAYDSGWLPLNPGQDTTLNHNISGDPDDYVVDLQFWESSKGIHQTAYGLYVNSSGNGRGGWWDKLTSNTVRVMRVADDTLVEKIRLRIWVYQ